MTNVSSRILEAYQTGPKDLRKTLQMSTKSTANPTQQEPVYQVSGDVINTPCEVVDFFSFQNFFMVGWLAVIHAFWA